MTKTLIGEELSDYCELSVGPTLHLNRFQTYRFTDNRLWFDMYMRTLCALRHCFGYSSHNLSSICTNPTDRVPSTLDSQTRTYLNDLSSRST